MKISAQMAMWMSAAFALICAGVAFSGFSSLGTIADETVRQDSLGFAWFWTFLAVVAVAFGILSWMIKEGRFGDSE